MFVDAYERATGERLVVEGMGERPDAVCLRPNGTLIGVELTQVRRSPKDAVSQAIVNYRDEMDAEDTWDEIARLLGHKARLRITYHTEPNILMIALRESDFSTAVALARTIPIEDLESTGFEEIWLADFNGIWDGAHREVRLFGLYPQCYRCVTGRSMFDQKPYG